MALSIEQEQEIADGLNTRLMIGQAMGQTLGQMFPEVAGSRVLGSMVDQYVKSIAAVAGECGIEVPTPEAFQTMVEVLSQAFATAVAAGYAVGSLEALEALEDLQNINGSAEAAAWADVLNGLVTDDDGLPITEQQPTESD